MSSGRFRKSVIFFVGFLMFMFVATALEFVFMYVETSTLAGKLLFFLLLNLNILAFLSLLYFVGVNMVRLVRERRSRILGHRFKTRMVAIFLILISIPSILLFFVATGLGTNYIDRFFTPQFRKPLESSIQMAQALYDMEKERTMGFAQLARNGQSLPSQYRVFFFDLPPEGATAAIQSAFEGEPYTEVISSARGDLIRAALPKNPSDPSKGIVVVETLIPSALSKSTGLVMDVYQDYVNLEKWRAPLKMNYMLLFGFFTVMIVFASLWLALKIATWITEPVRRLAEATEEVASGNLQVRVNAQTQDEMGMLVKSFNRMVGELQEGKESLQQAYINMENIVTNIQSGVISLDSKADVSDINEAACHILGIKEEDVRGKHYTAILSRMESDELQRLISNINVNSLKELERELWVTIDGNKMLLKIYITGMKDSLGKHTGILVVLDDLTDVFRAQRAIAWQEVARRMAHEIKNPLTPIKLSTERMLKKWQAQDGEFNSIFERSTQTIIREVEALRRMVDEFSRLGKMPELKRTPTDIHDVVNEVLELYRGFKSLNIEVTNSGPIPKADLDPYQFKRVLINLIDNAIEATDRKGHISVTINSDELSNRLQLEVADDGPGIPEEDKERLFQPYFSTRKNGTGLGLAIADKIVSEHGGTIRIKDNSPSGSIFSIEVPLRET